MSIDATIGTNNRTMPFVTGIIITPERTIILVLYAVLYNEQEESGCGFLVTQMSGALKKFDISRPEVLLNDGERALMNSLAFYFLGVPRQRCVWHVNNNIITNIKDKWTDEASIGQKRKAATTRSYSKKGKTS